MAIRKPGLSTDGERFSIVVCFDGSEESHRALRYAVRIGSGTDADLTLLYVRPFDQGLRTSGLDLSVVRENILSWGLDLPGMRVLKEGRDALVELGWLETDWEKEHAHAQVRGDPLGDNAIVYSSPSGRSIVLRLLVAKSVADGVLDECELGQYNLCIVGWPPATGGASGVGYITQEVANRIAREHSGTVLVSRFLEESHGHLVCVSNHEGSILSARMDAEVAARCACPIYLLSVAPSQTKLYSAKRAIARARAAIRDAGLEVSGATTLVGDPVTTIIEEGKKYSVIVMSRFRRRTGWRQFFSNSIAFKVLAKAKNSVMIVR
ncbi:MAG: universal stress protein [Alphaproteobacteria bacterium]|nr:universal stress protein [Alphaproteobacteria bacterium]